MNIQPGDIVSFEFLPYTPSKGLERTPSTYGNANLELAPVPMDLYMVCKDLSLAHWEDPRIPIGWELSIRDDVPYCRIAQYGFEPYEVRMTFRDRAPAYAIPDHNVPAGNRIEFCTASQCADVTEQKDSDLEVISKYNPDLAAAAAYIGDPNQTAALAKFAKGEMSYAEMRSMCG